MALSDLPDDLPIPEDDGACDHLSGMEVPSIILRATNDEEINIGSLNGYSVIYIYPMTGKPDVALPEGWNEIPGARDCTPQSFSFRDIHDDLKKNARLFGLSSQETDYQQEAKERLHLPFELLSDTNFQLKQQLALPTFTVEGVERYKRVTLIIENNIIKNVFYPVFPPDSNAGEVLDWFKT